MLLTEGQTVGKQFTPKSALENPDEDITVHVNIYF